MIRSSLPVLVIALASAASVGCAAETGGGGDTFPEQPFATIQSERGALTIAVRTAPAQPPGRGLTSIEYTIETNDGAADGLGLEVVPFMPSMGHGGASAEALALGGGRYVASDVSMYMQGRWELRASFSGAVSDSATVTFDIP